MQLAAVEHYLGGANKGDALRMAGYADSVAVHPKQVFNSPAVQGILERAGIDIDTVMRRLNHIASHAGKVQCVEFPPYRTSAFNPLEDEEVPDDDAENLTDEEIKSQLTAFGAFVAQIKHTKACRYVIYFEPDSRNQLDAIEKIINLHGIYAPKQTEVKVSVGVFSSYREKMEKRRKEGRIIDIGENRDATSPVEASEK